jgi:cytochrome c-type biogenesis protein CcmH/NrfF
MSQEKQASQIQRSGNWLKCPVCGGDHFWQREALLSTRIMTFIELDWINPHSDCYICENCRHILWFYGENEKP